ncbi:MAG: purine-nucleoside phosphorylase [Myxococcota bacterium]|nr:purine-nucleoside phosphorylase [Myxococcota bacterium]
MSDLAARVAEAERTLRDLGRAAPEVAVILGSGLGPVADGVRDAAVAPFERLGCLPAPTVPGHGGLVLLGTLGPTPAIVFQGRVHLYEGRRHAQVIVPVVLARRLGARTLVVTNAAGSLRPEIRPGSFVLISDHIDLGDGDPTGAHEGLLDGPKFTGLTDAYSPRLRRLAAQVAARFGVPAREGVYAMMRGPAYETPAEIRMLRTLGADVVGMSTVPEAIAARNLGMEVLGITTVTNLGAGIEGTAPAHEEVSVVAGAAGAMLARWIEGIVEEM